MKKTLLLVLLSTSFLFVFSQKTKIPDTEILEGAIKVHKEFDKTFGEESTLIPINEAGLIVAYMPKQKAVANMKDYEFKKFDADLKEVFTATATIPAKSKLIDFKVEGDFVYTLFEDKDGISIVKLNCTNKNTDVYSNTENGDFTPEKMVVNNSVVNVSGQEWTNKKEFIICCAASTIWCFAPMVLFKFSYIPVLFSVDMTIDGTLQNTYSMRNYIKKGASIIDMQTVDSAGTIDLLMQKSSGQSAKTFIRSTDGRKLSTETSIKKPSKMMLDEMKLNVLENQEKLVFGTYKDKHMLRSGTDGFFISSTIDNEQNYFKTIPWTDFKFHDNKIYKIIQVHMIFSDIIDKGDERVVFGEVYAPVYDGKSFMGYKRYGALTFGLDNKGNLLWENMMGIDGPQLDNLKMQFEFNETANNQYTVVNHEGAQLMARTFDKESGETDFKAVKIERGEAFSSGFNTNNTYASVKHWYNNVYIMTGIKTYKEKNKSGIYKIRPVFYIDKVEIPF